MKKNQHSNPKSRALLHCENKLAYHYTKNKEFIEKSGIGENFACYENIYEPKADEYPPNGLENYFAYKIEPKQKKLLLKLIKLTKLKIINNYRIITNNLHSFYLDKETINGINSMIDISFLRLPNNIKILDEENINKYFFFSSFLKTIKYKKYIYLFVKYTNDNNGFILPDSGMSRFAKDTIIFPISPELCLIRTSNIFLNENIGLLLETNNEIFLQEINNSLIEQAIKTFISKYKIK